MDLVGYMVFDIGFGGEVEGFWCSEVRENVLGEVFPFFVKNAVADCKGPTEEWGG